MAASLTLSAPFGRIRASMSVTESVMNDQQLDAVVIEPAQQATAAVIWLHGLGADGNDFVPIVPELGLPDEPAIRFVFPHAPVRAVTLNAGMHMRAWFDIHGLDAGAREDAQGLQEMRPRVDALIAAEQARGIGPERIVLAGFSQGGALALYAGLRHARRLAGIMGLSTWLPLRLELAAEAARANRETPVFMAHGDHDPVVSPRLGHMSKEFLADAGYAVEWHSYPMQHQVCLPEIRDIGAWLARVLT